MTTTTKNKEQDPRTPLKKIKALKPIPFKSPRHWNHEHAPTALKHHYLYLPHASPVRRYSHEHTDN
ncbi:hypothetical protein E2C01_090413 [Portunus trituberculatus]|uniref:Uncharacterized protein n=1 Tax=Portunus trituberculatus TaxID=210409 RepID=A0A5B7JGI3_PORTR|nr:hypothetical protein [Portunus trituberculatus]